MAKNIRKKFREGAASFYVVAFSTLILIILATSFAAIALSEASRTANDDLSQSAYDSALAGIEDAKIAFYNYQACKEQGVTASTSRPTGTGSVDCRDIVWYMEHPDCDMVAHILGRIGKDESGENGGVMIQETKKGDNLMQQAYTCVKINTKLGDYRSTLVEENPSRTVRVKLAGVSADRIEKVKVSWYSRTDGTEFNFTNFNTAGTEVQFPTLRKTKAPVPPTLAVSLVQTATNFSLSSFDKVTADATNRATMFLVPSDRNSANKIIAETSVDDNYIGVYKNGENVVTKDLVIKSNDRTVKNLPYAVYCPDGAEGEFACSTTIELPKAIGGTRNDETFMFVVSIPYGQPSTDFALEFFCANGGTCGSITADGVASNQAVLEGVQVNIDSTGRANNLYRRVEARLDSADTFFPYPAYAVELFLELNKDMTVKKEWSAGTYASNLNSLLAR